MKMTFKLCNANVTQEFGPAQQSYIRGLTEPLKIILASHSVKVPRNLFHTLGHILSKP